MENISEECLSAARSPITHLETFAGNYYWTRVDGQAVQEVGFSKQEEEKESSSLVAGETDASLNAELWLEI